MSSYLFRRDTVQPANLEARSFIDNVSRAMLEICRARPQMRYDLAGAQAARDAWGERLEMEVNELGDPDWPFDYGEILNRYGISVRPILPVCQSDVGT